MLLDLLARAPASLGRPIRLRLLTGGPLAADLAALAAPPQPYETPGAVLANTALAAPALAEVPDGVPTAAYLHEPGEVLDTLEREGMAQLVRCSRVLCVSEEVARDVVARGVAADRVAIVAPIVVDRGPVDDDEVGAIRATVDAGPRPSLVVGCGEAAWRKGADLFVEVAVHLAREDPDLRFHWVGRRIRAFARALDHDVSRTGLDGRLTWAGDVPDARPHLAAGDVLVLPSRFDPLPLVPLEAALVGTPTVGFALGGLQTLAEAGAVGAVPFPDTPALASAVRRVLDDPAWSASIVASGRRRVASHQSPEVVVPRFVGVLRDLLGCDPRTPTPAPA